MDIKVASTPGVNRPLKTHVASKPDGYLLGSYRIATAPEPGGLWHPYRRKWATERKHHSLKDVAAAGGWKDTETLLTCYQQPDADTLLAGMSEPKKMRDAALASG